MMGGTAGQKFSLVTNQGPSTPNFIEIGPEVPEEIFKESGY